MKLGSSAVRGGLLAASSVIALGLSAPAAASDEDYVLSNVKRTQEYGDRIAYAHDVSYTGLTSLDSPGIIIRNDINPNALPPAGNLDSGINGVGQMTIRANPTSTSMGLCTGTLVNPRTVIFAAHCVNTRPADAYGANGSPFGAWTTGGTPIAFGFEADNLPAVRLWLGLDGGQAAGLMHKTNTTRSLYAVEHVWWDPRSLNPGSSGFLTADIAIATLDTPAFGIPTWAMLFSPIDGPANAIQIGYGNRGNDNSSSIAIDWRRRSAENIISVLGSLDDRNQWLFGTGSVVNNLYMLSFSDPNPAYNPSAGKYDFGIFGGPSRGDAARPREGTTAAGDSGGPLILEDKFDKQVVIGVLSGGSRFFTPQAGHNYGTHSFYQPLHVYWETIVANNNYVYAGNKGGNGNWEDPNHWVQMMDPNYMIIAGGQLVNGLPDTPEEGVTGSGAKFGYICFLDDCTQLNQAAATGNGDYIIVPGGPGSINFVPNNVVANPAAGVRPRYYDVTLSAAGTTRLNSSVTIDMMTLDGQTKLDVARTGSLRVLGEYNQYQGWTNVDGTITSGLDAFFLSGLLAGSGTLKAPFVTVVGALVAPAGSNQIGTLTVDGNLILASASSLMIDVQQGRGDRINVTGELALGGGTVVFTPTSTGRPPRHNDSYVIASAAGGVSGAFGNAITLQGVLVPELSYGPHLVTARFRAGSLAANLQSPSATSLAYARALDTLRSTSYNQLWNLYGSIDWLNGHQLSAALGSLAPKIVGETQTLQGRQSRNLLGAVGDRIGLIGTGQAQGVTMDVNGLSLLSGHAYGPNGASARLGFGRGGSAPAPIELAGGITGFVSGSIEQNRSGYGKARSFADGQHGWNIAMGLEVPVSSNAVIGTAAGYSEAQSAPNGDRSETRTTMGAAYGSVSLGGGAYIGGLAAAEMSRADIQRLGHDGVSLLDLAGASNATRYTASAEAGVRRSIGRGLAVTPRAQLSYGHYRLGGFTERGGETALGFEDIGVTRLETRLGAKLDGSTTVAGWSVKPQLQADYVRALSDNGGMAMVRFAAAPEHSFELPIGGAGRSWGEIKGGFEISRDALTLGLKGQTAVGDSPWADTRGGVDLKIRF